MRESVPTAYSVAISQGRKQMRRMVGYRSRLSKIPHPATRISHGDVGDSPSRAMKRLLPLIYQDKRLPVLIRQFCFG